MPSPVRLLLASSNPGKLGEFRVLATGHKLDLALFPRFDSLPAFDESAPTFAENAAGKALHYSRFTKQPVMADDSGLVVPALGGAPGVKSARYAGLGATDADRVQKLLGEMRGKPARDREARFVCVLAVAQAGHVLTVVSDFVTGELLEEPRGADGFGYDPIFFSSVLGKSLAEISRIEKNSVSHRGKAFRKLLAAMGT